MICSVKALVGPALISEYLPVMGWMRGASYSFVRRIGSSLSVSGVLLSVWVEGFYSVSLLRYGFACQLSTDLVFSGGIMSAYVWR